MTGVAEKRPLSFPFPSLSSPMAGPVTALPNPNDIRRQYSIDSNGQKGPGDAGGITPGMAMVAATQYGAIVPIAGAAKGRLRAKTAVAATLRARFMLADGATEATTSNPADVALAAGVENVMDLTFSGEGQLHVIVVNGAGPGALNYVDFSQL